MSNENLTEKTLADVQAGIQARDAEIAALRKENAELREQLENFGNDTKMVAGCCGRSECGGECGNDWVGMVPAQQPVSGADELADGEIDIADVRQYLQSWGCLAHPGVRALVDGYQSSTQPSWNAGELDEDSEFMRWLNATCTYDDLNKPEIELAKDAWQARAALAQQDADKVDAGRWISVNERLPEIHEWRAGSIAGISDAVLTIDEDDPDTMTVQHLRKGGQGDLTTLYWDHGDSPTHWRPAPSLPGIDAARKEQE